MGQEGRFLMIGYDPIVTASAAKQIAEHIRAAILQGKLKKEERLPTEEELAARFGVSRPTVREALKRLAAQKLISSRRGPAGGTFVNSLGLVDLAENVTSAATMLVSVGELQMDEIAEARTELEGLCCRLAIAHGPESVVSDLRRILDRQKDPTVSDEQFCDLDVQFHRTIVDATNNTMLRFVMYAMIEALVPITNMVIVYVRDRTKIVSFHEQMLHALDAKKPEMMQNALADLIGYLSERYAEATEMRDKRTAAARN
jgi:DNA-binding FadR family transcriptional regulator